METPYFSVFEFQINTPAFFAAALALFLLSGLFWLLFLLWWRDARRTLRAKRAVVLQGAPRITQEIYVDETSFSLLGLDWEWAADVPIDYGCPECNKRVRTSLRQFYHVPSGQTYSFMRHHCVETASTSPVEAIRKE